MSVFLDILRCVLCCEDDYHDRDILGCVLCCGDDYNDHDHGRISHTSPYSQDSHSHIHTTTTYSTFTYPIREPQIQSFSSSGSTSTPLLRDYLKNQIRQQREVDSLTGYSAITKQAYAKNLLATSGLSKPPPLPSSPKPPQPSPKPSPSIPKLPITLSSSSTPSPSIPKLPTSSRPSPCSPKPPPSSPHLSSKSQPSSSKPILSPLPSDPSNQQTKANYVWVQKGTSSYAIPEEIKDLIKRDIVPGVLNRPVVPSTYKDYFAALLYAEDFYIEKWSKFQLENVTLDLEEAAIYVKSSKNKYLNEYCKKEEKIFVALKVDSVRERRPFLLSRDFVFVRPSGRKAEPFQGIIYRVVKSTLVLVEFGKDFHSQHHATRKYDVSFSFNRVCLTHAHKAVEAASDPLFQNFIFPDCTGRDNFILPPPISFNRKLEWEQNAVVLQILRAKAPTPYLLKGSLCITGQQLSKTGSVVRDAVLRIYETNPKSRILICTPINRTCDVLMRSFKEGIPESDMFRANAAFREIDGVPIDILPSCVYEGECFACPPLGELRKFRVILSTFVSSFRLHHEGITAGHFSHILLVDASSATEPETMVVLANLADEKTVVVVTGAPENCSGWVRSDIARQNGLKRSYFERL